MSNTPLPSPQTASSVTQSDISAGGDVISGSKITNTTINLERNASVVEQLLVKLQDEIEHNIEAKATIESLRHFYQKKSIDGIDGLEAKLAASDRHHEIQTALEKKEIFAKALERWSLYSSSQEIFVHLLAKAEHEFSMHVTPQLSNLSEHQINNEVTKRIINPIVHECGATVFQMHHGMAMGMLYWLAEQCFVRWHS